MYQGVRWAKGGESIEDEAMTGDRAPSGQTGHGARLIVTKHSPKTGFWLWRRASYKVFEEQSDGARTQVVAGRFRSHREALEAARRALGRRSL